MLYYSTLRLLGSNKMRLAKSALVLLLTVRSTRAMKSGKSESGVSKDVGTIVPSIEFDNALTKLRSVDIDVLDQWTLLMQKIIKFGRNMNTPYEKRTVKQCFDVQDFIRKVSEQCRNGWTPECFTKCRNALETLENNWMGLVVFAFYKHKKQSSFFHGDKARAVKFPRLQEQSIQKANCTDANAFVNSKEVRKILRRIGKDCRIRTRGEFSLDPNNKNWHNCVGVKNALIGEKKALIGKNLRAEFFCAENGVRTMRNPKYMALVSNQREDRGDNLPADPITVKKILFVLEYYTTQENFKYIHGLPNNWDWELVKNNKSRSWKKWSNKLLYKNAHKANELLGLSNMFNIEKRRR